MRTAEQIAADEALAAAIQRNYEAYIEAPRGIITEYLVVYAARYFDADGDDSTAVNRIVSWPPPLHQQLGLLDYSAAEYPREGGRVTSFEATRADLIRGLVERFQSEACSLELPSDYAETAEVALAYFNERIEPGMQAFIQRFDVTLSELAEARAELQRLRPPT